MQEDLDKLSNVTQLEEPQYQPEGKSEDDLKEEESDTVFPWWERMFLYALLVGLFITFGAQCSNCTATDNCMQFCAQISDRSGSSSRTVSDVALADKFNECLTVCVKRSEKFF